MSDKRGMIESPPTPTIQPIFSEEAERGVLGSIAQDSEKVMRMLKKKGVTPEDFYYQEHRVIASTLYWMAEGRKPIDLLTIHEYLKNRGELDTIGGLPYLQEIIDGTPTTAHAQHYANIILDKSALRGVVELCNDTTAMAYSGVEGRDIVDNLQRQSASLRFSRNTLSIESAKDIALAQVRDWQGIADGNISMGTPTCFDSLRRSLPVYRKSMTLLLAERGFGKSTAMCQEARFSAKLKGIPTAILSLEQPVKEIMGRIIAGEADVNTLNLDGGKGRDGDIDNARRCAEEIDYPLYVVRPKRDLRSVVDTMEMLYEEHGVTAMWLDHFRKVDFADNRGPNWEGVSTELADICLDRFSLGVLGHLKVDRDLKTNGKPKSEQTMDNVKFCDALNDDARQVLVGVNDPEGSGDKYLKLEKNNQGGTAQIVLKPEFNRFRFEDMGHRCPEDAPR